MRPGDLVVIRDNWRPLRLFPDNQQLMVGDIAIISRAATPSGAYEILSPQGVFILHFCYLEVISETQQ